MIFQSVNYYLFALFMNFDMRPDMIFDNLKFFFEIFANFPKTHGKNYYTSNNIILY